MRPLRILAAAAALTAAVLFASPALADTGHFHSATSAVDNGGALAVAVDERGLGTADVDYLLTANASAVYACVNGGGQHPAPANKETVNAEVSANATFEPKNGRVVASITAGPPSAGAVTCPPGQRLVLTSLAYTGGVLGDLTNGVSIGVPDASGAFVAV